MSSGLVRGAVRVVSAAAFVVTLSQAASAALLIQIDKAKQQMIVSRDMVPLYVWPVSSGLAGEYETPSGSYKPFRMEEDHFSREWDDAPMPHSIFFTMKGHAIHGTTHIKAIGNPASHGCVRLEPKNAKILFELVKKEKMANTRVVLEGTTPPSAVAKKQAPAQAALSARTDPDDVDADVTAAVPRPPRDLYDNRPMYPDRGYDGRAARDPYYDRGRRAQREVYYERGGRLYVERNGRLYAVPNPDWYRPQQRGWW